MRVETTPVGRLAGALVAAAWIGVVSFDASATPLLVRCEYNVKDKAACDVMPGVCDKTFELDLDAKTVRVMPAFRGQPASELRTRLWTEHHIEASDAGGSATDKAGRLVYTSNDVVVFDRNTGEYLSFTEYRGPSGKVLPQDELRSLAANGYGGFLGVDPDQRVITGRCAATRRAF